MNYLLISMSYKNKMKKILILSAFIFLTACSDSNKDGSSKSSYSSCKIISSEALYAKDRDNDLKQCWNAEGAGFASQGDTLQWCERQVNSYVANQHTFGHSVKYAIESTYCK